jgi:hypothetical protein
MNRNITICACATPSSPAPTPGNRRQSACTATAKQQLVGIQPGGGKNVMMTDILYKWTWGGWAYNHSDTGASAHWVNMGYPIDMGPPRISGVNRLMGDGSAGWNDVANYNLTAMQTLDPSLGWVRGGASDTTFY